MDKAFAEEKSKLFLASWEKFCFSMMNWFLKSYIQSSMNPNAQKISAAGKSMSGWLCSVLLCMGASFSQAALIHAGGNVTLVSTSTVFDLGNATLASDGNIEPNGNNGQIYTNDPSPAGGDYFVDSGSNIVFDINLGSAFTIDAIAFWNRGGFNGNSVSSFSTVFSDDATFGDADDSQAFDFTPAINIGGTQQDFALPEVVSNVQYVRVTIDDNYFGSSGGGDRVNFTEFQFNAIPEPSSVLVLGVFGLLGFSLRRRG